MINKPCLLEWVVYIIKVQTCMRITDTKFTLVVASGGEKKAESRVMSVYVFCLLPIN